MSSLSNGLKLLRPMVDVAWQWPILANNRQSTACAGTCRRRGSHAAPGLDRAIYRRHRAARRSRRRTCGSYRIRRTDRDATAPVIVYAEPNARGFSIEVKGRLAELTGSGAFPSRSIGGVIDGSGRALHGITHYRGSAVFLSTASSLTHCASSIF